MKKPDRKLDKPVTITRCRDWRACEERAKKGDDDDLR